VVIGFGSVADMGMSEKVARPGKKKAVMTMHASGTFEVKVNVQKADNKEAESAKCKAWEDVA
jgi:2-methylaconitate cis-trans-isomerase PrpF